MKPTIKVLIIAIIFPLFAFSQSMDREFEGIIKYKHSVIAKDSSYNVEYDYAGIGHYSEFYYKEGDYKFVNHNCFFNADLFRSKEQKNYLLLNHSDTVLCLDATISDAEIVDYNIKTAVDTILGNPCDVITIKMKPVNAATPVSYRRYYYSKKLAVDPKHFLGCKANAYELIYGQTRSLALRIEFEWPNKIIRWEAYEVSRTPVSNETFTKSNSWILNKVN